MPETKDLREQKFGDLYIIDKHKQSRNGGASWICQCSCGRIVIINGSELLSGNRKNCGDCNYGVYDIHDDYAECTLPSGNRFTIDLEDYPMVSQYKWVTNPAGYFLTSLGSKNEHQFLHRLIINPPDGKFIDHIDGDKSNCRRENLRICTQKENNRNVGLTSNNRSGYKGVHWAADRGKWRAEITVDGKHIKIGSFETAEDAARAYDEYALFYFEEFAKTNAMLGLLSKESKKAAV